MNRLRHILSVLLVCLLICSMSVTAFAAGEQGGNSTVRANVPAAVTYDANGGSGTMEADSVAVGEELTLPQCGFTAPGGTPSTPSTPDAPTTTLGVVETPVDAVLPSGEQIPGETYAPGEKITVDSHITVKAVWEDVPNSGTSDIPQTGDNSHLLLWTVLLLVSSFSIVLLLVSRKRRTN